MLSKCGDKIKIIMVSNYGHVKLKIYKKYYHYGNKIYGHKIY